MCWSRAVHGMLFLDQVTSASLLGLMRTVSNRLRFSTPASEPTPHLCCHYCSNRKGEQHWKNVFKLHGRDATVLTSRVLGLALNSVTGSGQARYQCAGEMPLGPAGPRTTYTGPFLLLFCPLSFFSPSILCTRQLNRPVLELASLSAQVSRTTKTA